MINTILKALPFAVGAAGGTILVGVLKHVFAGDDDYEIVDELPDDVQSDEETDSE